MADRGGQPSPPDPRLVVLAGAPATGKTTVAQLLLAATEDAGWVDGDDLWRINPWVVNDRTKRLVEDNLVAVLGNFLDAGYSTVILSWVLPRASILSRLVAGLGDRPHQLWPFVLTCSRQTLAARFAADPARGEVTAAALACLAQTRRLPWPQINTDGRSAAAVAAEVDASLRAGQGGPG